MTLPIIPPRTEELVDENSYARLPWVSFFDQVADGDSGTTWTPTFVGLTEVGTATKTGVYLRLSKKLVYFRIVITPATSTTAVLGTTYCDNFPLTISANGFSTSCSTFTVASAGVTASDKRIYTGAWAAIASPITITGIIEAQ